MKTKPSDFPEIDYSKYEIKKLPPGKAYGADDLTRWSHRVANGKSGVQYKSPTSLRFKCDACGAVREVMQATQKNQISRRMKKKCHCGGISTLIAAYRIRRNGKTSSVDLMKCREKKT